MSENTDSNNNSRNWRSGRRGEDSSDLNTNYNSRSYGCNNRSQSYVCGGGGNRSQCYNCGENGHLNHDCTDPKKQTQSYSSGRNCFNYGTDSHLSRECSEPKKIFTYRSNQGSNVRDFKVTRDLSNLSTNKTECKKMNSNSNPSLNTMTRTTAMPLSGHKVQLRSHSPFVDFAIEENLKLMMSSSNIEDGLMLFNFETIYKNRFKELLDWKKFGFTSLVEFLKSMPHLVILLPTGTGTYKLVPNKSSDCLKIERQILRQSKESLEEIERQISSRIDGEEEQIDWGTASNACKALPAGYRPDSPDSEHDVSEEPKYNFSFTSKTNSKQKVKTPKPLLKNRSEILIDAKIKKIVFKHMNNILPDFGNEINFFDEKRDCIKQHIVITGNSEEKRGDFLNNVLAFIKRLNFDSSDKEVIVLKEKYCGKCYSYEHTTTHCVNCLYCLGEHLIENCPLRGSTVYVRPRLLGTSDKYKKYVKVRQRLHRKYKVEHSAHWRSQFFEKSVASPVGLYSMDIEGGFGNDGNPSHTIVIHGYYKPPIGAEVYYHCNINSMDRLTNPGFEFSNISIPQIENGKCLDEVKKDVLRILNGKKCFMHSSASDLIFLGISDREVKDNNIVICDLAEIFSDKYNPTLKVSLKEIVFYFKGVKIQEYSEGGPHNCEIDSRYTLLSGVKYEKRIAKGEKITYSDVKDFIRNAIKNGQIPEIKKNKKVSNKV